MYLEEGLKVRSTLFFKIKLSHFCDKFTGSDRTVRTGHPGQFIDDKVTVGRMVCRIFLEQENFSREKNSSNYYFEESLGLERNKEGKENVREICASIFCEVFVSTKVLRNKIISTAFGGWGGGLSFNFFKVLKNGCLSSLHHLKLRVQ